MNVESRLLTVGQSARFLGCSEANIYALLEAGELPFVPIGRRKGYRIDVKDLEAFIDSRKQQKAAPPPQKMAQPKLKHIRLQ